MTTAGTAKHWLLGTWRIVETESWDVGDLDLLEPAHLTLETKGRGKLGLLAIEAAPDYRVVQRDGLQAIEFSFEGSDEGNRISGRGWAVLDGEQLRGRLFFIRATTLGLWRGVFPWPRRIGAHGGDHDPQDDACSTREEACGQFQCDSEPGRGPVAEARTPTGRGVISWAGSCCPRPQR
jgi:hypothetical protein